MEVIIKVLVGAIVAIAGWLFYERSRNKKLQQENAILKVDGEMKENVFKFEEARKEAMEMEDRYNNAASEFRKLYGDGSGLPGTDKKM